MGGWMGGWVSGWVGGLVERGGGMECLSVVACMFACLQQGNLRIGVKRHCNA